MKQSRAGGSASTRVVVGLTVFVVLCAWSGTLQANTTNTVPYSESFEGYAAGTVLVDSNGVGTAGWYGGEASTSALATVVNQEYTYTNALPIPAATHTNILTFNGTVSNVFAGSQYDLWTNLVVDTMMQAGYLNADPPVGVDAQVAVYVNTNGLLVLRHALYNNLFTSQTQVWTVMTNGPTLASNQWFRLTINIDYLTGHALYQDHYFQISVDGGSPISGDIGYPSIPAGTTGPHFGPWIVCADSGGATGQRGPNNRYFSGLGLMGVGSVDDLVVNRSGQTTNVPPPPSPLVTWLGNNGYTTNDLGRDDDSDGATVGDEYCAQTNPHDSNSVFKVNSVVYGASSHEVVWGGSTTTALVFRIYRSTDLLATVPPGGWSPYASNILGNLSGVNQWLDTLPPNGPVFYKPAVPNILP